MILDMQTRYKTGPFAELFGAPDYAPHSWSKKPDWLEPGQGLTVLDSGQVAGYFFDADTCIIDGSRECWKAPPSSSGYAAFHQSDWMTDEGELLSRFAGLIGNTGGHAGTRRGREALEFYQNPNLALMQVRAGDDEHGGWVAGRLLPHCTFADVDLIRRSALSGHWEFFVTHPTQASAPWPRKGQYDCLGPTLVNRPGLPLPMAASVGVPSMFGTNIGLCDCEDEMEIRLAAVIGDTGLPLNAELEWDSEAAVQRVKEYASSDGSGDAETIDFDTYARAFFYLDDEADPATTEAYGFPFADVVDGDLTAITAGIQAVKSRLAESDLSQEDQDAISTKADDYLGETTDEGTDMEAAITIGRGKSAWRVQQGSKATFAKTRSAAMAYAHSLAMKRTAAIGDGAQFEAILFVQGVESSDGRTIETTTWRELPQPVYAQTEIDWGHDGAQIVGRVDEIEVQSDGTVFAKGVLDDSEFASQISGLIESQMLQGVSVDVGSYENIRIKIDEEVEELDDAWEEGGEVDIGDGIVHEVYEGAELMGFTIVGHPAFAESKIWLVNSEPTVQEQVASLDESLKFLVTDRLAEKVAALKAPALPPSALEKRIAALREKVELSV